MTIPLVIIVIAALLAALLLVRLRFWVDLSPERRILFIGLGRTGPEFDFRSQQLRIKLFGLSTMNFLLRRQEKSMRKKSTDKPPAEPKGARVKSKRQRPVSAVVDALPQCWNALWGYVTGLFRAAIVEQAEGEIEAGFGAPHVTGQVFGYYQAALAIAPAWVGRFRYTPVWTEQTFSGALRVSIAWPVYRIIWQTMLLIWRLPKRKIIRLAIGKKKGEKRVE